MKLLIARAILATVFVGCVGLLLWSFISMIALANGGNYLWATIDILGFCGLAAAITWAIYTVSNA